MAKRLVGARRPWTAIGNGERTKADEHRRRVCSINTERAHVLRLCRRDSRVAEELMAPIFSGAVDAKGQRCRYGWLSKGDFP